MATKFNDCLCQLSEMLGNSKSLVTNMLTSLISLLQALKATTLLFAIDLDDTLRRIKYEAELTIIQEATGTIQSPLSMLQGYLKYLSDCDPAVSLAQTLKEVHSDLIGDLEDRTYELEMLISTISDKQKKLAVIDKRIKLLEEIRDALDACG